MALAVYEYKFTVPDVGDVTFSSNTRIMTEQQRLSGNGLTLQFWLHGYATDVLLEAKLAEIASLSVDFDRLIRHTYPGMKGFTAIDLDGEGNLGVLEKRGGGGTWSNCIMNFPRVHRYYPPQPDGTRGCMGSTDFLQLAPG